MYKLMRRISSVNTFFYCLFLLCILLVSSSASAQFFSETQPIETSVDESTSVIFVGDIKFTGSFQAVSLDSFFEPFSEYLDVLGSSVFPADLQAFSTWEHIYGVPVFSETTITKATVFEINTTILSSVDQNSIEDIITVREEAITTYEQVSISIQEGLALIGSNIQDYSVDHPQSYGFGGLFQVQLSEDFPTSGLGIISDHPSMISSETNHIFLYPLESVITIEENNQKIRTFIDTENILLIKTDDAFNVTQDAILHFFPLLKDENADAMVSLSVERSETPDSDLLSLITTMNETLSVVGENPVQEIISFDESIHSMIPLISQILNSGMIIINATQPIKIGETISSKVDIIAGRGPSFSMTIDQQSTAPIYVTGASSLLFINDHLFTEAASTSNNGISIPIWSILLWITAIASIIFFVFMKKRNQIVSHHDDELAILQNNWVKSLIPISVILICFLLIDITFSVRFGLSFFSVLSMQTNAVIIGVFLLIQLVILIIIFIMYALPARFIHDMLCNTLINNKYQRISKILVVLPLFWIGIQLYFLVIFNIILSFFTLPSLPGLG